MVENARSRMSHESDCFHMTTRNTACPSLALMKLIGTALALAALTACANRPAPTAPDSTKAEIAEAIRAFEDVCLKTAPTFSKAAAAAAGFGIGDITDVGFMKMGFNKDQSLGVQIKDNKECVITTPSQSNATLTRQFLQAVGRSSGTTPSNRVPVKATVGGESFIFQHDRKGGEAFVMLKLNG